MRVLACTIALLACTAATGAADTLLVADKTGHKLLYLDTASGRVLRAVPVGENPHEVIVARDGRTAFVANPGSNSVSVVDIASGIEQKRLTSPLFGFPHGLAAHPDGETLSTFPVGSGPDGMAVAPAGSGS
jgi:DNA-binding beta-propeller fold protein YncE